MAVRKGVLLGMVNVVVIAIVIGIIASDRATIGCLRHEMTAFVIMFAGIPGAVAGALIGVLAAITRTCTPRLRIALLTGSAVAVVLAIAAVFRAFDLVTVASIPTIAAALVLESWTRRATPPPRVPVAIARPQRC